MKMNQEILDCYKLSKCIENKPVVVFEKHNMALPIWGYFAHKLNKQLNLITFDTHTDTQPPFAGYSANHPISNVKSLVNNPKIRFGDKFSFSTLYKMSKEYLCNAEHIETGIELNHLQSFKAIYRSNEVDEFDFVQEAYAQYFHFDDINWEVLYQTSAPIALDFDLDYFYSLKDMGISFEKKIAPLIKKASVITIALERNFFYETAEAKFTLEIALERLEQIIEKSLKNK